jgi:hypothetical protein
MCELLWSDPSTLPGRTPSKRGVGVCFGACALPWPSCCSGRAGPGRAVSPSLLWCVRPASALSCEGAAQLGFTGLVS